MANGLQQHLAAHLQRHARRLHNVACGLGRARDADDVLQILYARWWRRMQSESGWLPPEGPAELFVSVKRVVLDEIAKEKRSRLRDENAGRRPRPAPGTPEESLHAFERLRWILAHLPASLAEVLTASLSAGRNDDAAVARELGITHAAYTLRLFRARRAAEELAAYYDVLTPDLADVMAALAFGGKSPGQLASDLHLPVAELTARHRRAMQLLEQHRTAVVR